MFFAFVSACKSGPNLSADYAQSAEENFVLAQNEFADRDFEEAITYAEFIRIRFPFSRYAVEAELLVARAEFEQGSYLAGREAFKNFTKMHPGHEHVQNGWSSYMAAVCAYMNAPESMILFPPDYQRDQGQLKESLDDLAAFFDRYGESIMAPLATQLRDTVRKRLLRHELYVTRFHLKNNHPESAIVRLELARREFGGLGLDAEVLFLLGITYLRVDEIELARSTFAELQMRHATDFHGKQARAYLQYIAKNYGPANPSRPRPLRTLPVPKPPPVPKNRQQPEKPELARSATAAK